jgi:aminobenzoyl-glutamate transport protein
VERGGNALPHPADAVRDPRGARDRSRPGSRPQLDVSVVHDPATGKVVAPVNLLSLEGLHRILTNLVTNFTGFAPLGTVLVALIGIGVAEQSGIDRRGAAPARARRRRAAADADRRVRRRASNMASEIGYVLLVPLAGLIFQAVGRHPILGMAAAFAGVSGGYSANLLIGTIDPLLAGLSQEAARIVDPAYTVTRSRTGTSWSISTPWITLLGWFVTEKIVAPRFPGVYRAAVHGGKRGAAAVERSGAACDTRASRRSRSPRSSRSSHFSSGPAPGAGLPAQARDRRPVSTPACCSGVVAVIFIAGTLLGIAYGVGAGTIRSDEDVMKGMSQQHVGARRLHGAGVLRRPVRGVLQLDEARPDLRGQGRGGPAGANLHAVPLFVAFILLTAVVNLFMGSASAKWALMAPVFVPMFMLLGYCARAHAGGVPGGRQRHERDLADDELLRADHRVRAALRAEGRHRHARGDDAALYDGRS